MEKDWTKNCQHINVQQFVHKMDLLQNGQTSKCPFCENGVVRIVENKENYRKFACDTCDMYYEVEAN